MARVRYSAPIESIEGEWAPGSVCRQKKFIVGRKVVAGPMEVYHKKKRDYKRLPMTQGEQQTVDRFRQAEAQRKLEMQDPERMAYWKARFDAQTERPEAGNKKSYLRLDTFIRAMLMKSPN